MRVTPKTIKQNLLWAAASIAIAGFAGQAVAMPFAKRLLFTVALEHAKPPVGWNDFCGRNPGDCQTDPYSPREVAFSDEAFDQLTNINRLVNSSIKPKTDRKHWGVADKWSYPDDGYGDCEDYALLKRKLLIETGWSPSALLVAVVWDKDAGHAVLLARTDKGEYVLDNQSSKVVLWSSTRYKFVKRQSPRDLNQWIYVDGDPRKPNLELAAWEKAMPDDKPVLTAGDQAVPAEVASVENQQVAATRAQPADTAVDQPMKAEARLAATLAKD
jgi:predicted transglutaminase-like cysteine proteinase